MTIINYNNFISPKCCINIKCINFSVQKVKIEKKLLTYCIPAVSCLQNKWLDLLS